MIRCSPESFNKQDAPPVYRIAPRCAKISAVQKLALTANELTQILLALEDAARLALFDSCARTLGESRYLIAAIYPRESFEFRCESAAETVAALRFLDEKLEFYNAQSDCGELFGGGICAATLSYEFGLLLENIAPRNFAPPNRREPAATFNFYDTVVVHDYVAQQTFVVGKQQKRVAELLLEKKPVCENAISTVAKHDFTIARLPDFVESNFSRDEYLRAVAEIQQHIRRGDIYQANLTQQLCARLPENRTPEQIFAHLRRAHPAPFAAFVRRERDVVVSASPERFLKISRDASRNARIITAAPIKGTRARGANPHEDERLRRELAASAKDRAENTMIVDLLRNDIGRVCEFGSVAAVKLCEIEAHETLFHLVSTVTGTLRANARIGDVLTATFPCGSITGAPKISAMHILNRIETAPRNLSMGAIGYFAFDGAADLNVAIRTMTICDRTAVFNVGGGIVADSAPAAEYAESLLKAGALIAALQGA